MRIACVGNIANNFFREVQALNRFTDIEAVLYLHKGNKVSNTALPESDDPNLADSYPDWIRVLPEFANFDRLSALGLKPRSELFSRLMVELDSFDICLFSSIDVFYIQYLKTCTIYRATGSDLTVFPVFSYTQFFRLRPVGRIDIKKQPIQYLKKNILFYLRRNNYRRAIDKASYINSSKAEPYQHALKKLKVLEQCQIDLLPLAIDTRIFSSDTLKANLAAKKWTLIENQFTVFIPSRMMIKQTDEHKMTGQWKASDLAIHAFNDFLQALNEEQRTNVVLLIPDRTQSDDLAIAKTLVSSLSMENHVKYIKGQSATGLTRHELIQLYSVADVVLDDFGAGWYGSVVVEALSCSCPVITYVTEKLMNKFSWHPILSAHTREDISAAIHKLYKDPIEKEKLGQQSRLWVEEFHSQKSVSIRSAESLKTLCQKQ